MKKAFVLFLLALFFGFDAIEGMLYAQGNQLIPIAQTDISLKKELLTIVREGRLIKVTADYEFFNPSKPKDQIVCFEAAVPDMRDYYHVDQVFPENPCLHNFKVVVNDENVPYEVAHVRYLMDENYRRSKGEYFVNGKFLDMTYKQCEEAFNDDELTAGGMDFPFYYVYYFNARFKEGKNVVRHTYEFDLSYSIEEEFYFGYGLTGVNRWANCGADDFTLELDMGERETFLVCSRFFDEANGWEIKGKGKMVLEQPHTGYVADTVSPQFHIQEGSAVFHKKGFRPQEGLYVQKRRWEMSEYVYEVQGRESFEGDFLVHIAGEQYCNLDVNSVGHVSKEKFTVEQKRILKNLPFAYRGYVFKDKGLREFFESTKWYIPDPYYKSDMTNLSQKEKEWVQFWSK